VFLTSKPAVISKRSVFDAKQGEKENENTAPPPAISNGGSSQPPVAMLPPFETAKG